MLSLIKKDMLVHHWLVYSSFLIIIILLTITTLPATFTIFICLFGLAFSLFQYDYMKKVNLFLKSLPVTENQIVISRYVFSLFILSMILIAQWIIQSIFINVLDGFPAVYQLNDFYVFFMLSCVLIGMFYPILYFFKNMYMALTVIVALIAVGTFYTIDVLVKELQMTNEIIFNDIDIGLAKIVERLLPFYPYLALFIIISIFLILSAICSIYLYKRKMY